MTELRENTVIRGLDAGSSDDLSLSVVPSDAFGAMSKNYAPQRKLLLSLQHEAAQAREGVLIQRPKPGVDAGRQAALSIPESVRALGETLSPFFDACGGRTRLSLAVWRDDREATPETYVFEQPFVLIGRCPEGDLTLSDATVGFRHFYLQLIEGRWSFVNLARVARVASAGKAPASGWFDPGDELRAGPYTIRHLAPPDQAVDRQPATPSSTARGMQPVRLEMLNGLSESRRKRVRTLTNAITLIGASGQCDLSLRDDSVSGIHAGVVLTPDGAWVVDLLGRDGILVDDHRVYWKQIHEGTELRIGRFRFRVRFNAGRERSSLRTEAPADDEPPLTSAMDALSGGSLTGGAVLALVRQLAEMQNQFFEHSQLQMQLMSEMVAHLRGSQQVSVRRDLARIDEIGRELKTIQLQLASSPAPAASRSASPATASETSAARRAAPLPGSKRRGGDARASTPQVPSSGHGAASVAGEASDGSGATPHPIDPAAERPPAPPLANANSTARRPPRADLPPAAPRRGPPEVSGDDAHARLTRRMAKLAQERNNRWRQVLQAFKRKPSE